MKQKSYKKYLLVTGLLIFSLLAGITGCGGDSEPVPDVVVWTHMTDKELKAMKEIAAKFNEETGQYVAIIGVPFSELKIKYQIAAPAGQGPDLITGPQDWIGGFATAELIEPLSETEFTQEQKDLYNKVALESMTYNNKMYGLPLLLDTLVIVYNKDLIEEVPTTMDELLTQAAAFNNPDAGKYGFFYDIKNLYFSWPILAGFGAEIFGENNGKLDVNKVLLDSPETREGLEYLRSFKTKYDLIPKGATNDMMNGIFFNRNMQFCINGPWMLKDLYAQEINFDIMAMPPLPNGKRPRPFVGIQGILLNSQAKNRPLAVKFAHYVSKPENQKKLCLASGRIPSRYDTLEQLQDNEAIVKFAQASEYGMPMPNHPAMDTVWEPMGEALNYVIFEDKDPGEVLQKQVKRIKEDITLMME